MQSVKVCLWVARMCRRRRAVHVCVVCAILFLIYHFLTLEPKPACATKIEIIKPKSKKGFQLVILIMTAPKHFRQRDIIRQTWLSDSKNFEPNGVRHYFVIGTEGLPMQLQDALAEEQFRHHDLLLLTDFEDAYDKLTEKLALMFEWADKNLNFSYVFKADDDTYAILDPIMKELNGIDYQPDLYWGHFSGKGRVETEGPWKETEWKLCDYYLPYAKGGGYILSRSLVSFVARNWKQFQMYHSEDVSLGAWLAPLRLNRVHDPRFDTEYKSRGCKNTFIVSHKQNSDDMLNKFNTLKTLGRMCRRKTVVMYGYNYNWGVPPSQCCKRSRFIP